MFNRRWMVALGLCIALIASACGGVRHHIDRGDALLRKGKHSEAIEAYEQALRESPGHQVAKERIRQARRAAVRAQLEAADRALAAEELAKALRHAMRARRLPLDLEDVDLVRRIDETVSKTAAMAEQRVREYVDQGQFIPAVILSRDIMEASPGVTSRRKWAEQIRDQAVEHYLSLSEQLVRDELFGSAAIQLAVARFLGEEIAAERVQRLWSTFSEPVCFASPRVVVEHEGEKTEALAAKIETTARLELETLRASCGEGSRELGVRIQLTDVDLRDDTQVITAAKPLPGHDIQTEEVYYEEIPYTAVEKYTDYEVRVEKKERRDCAPRPGKERGCVTWTEEVEVKVPIEKTREVQKVKKVKRTRPISGPLPEDKVLAYDVKVVKRKVAYKGTIQVTGEASSLRPFEVSLESSDRSNERAEREGLVVEADPLEVKPMSALAAEAAEAVAEEVREAVAESASEWAKDYEQRAHKHVVAGQMPQAEELFLKMLSLGVTDNRELRTFFDSRYGRSVRRVMDMLAVAMGRETPKRQTAEGDDSKQGYFPTRQVAGESTDDEGQSTAATTGRMEKPIETLPEKEEEPESVSAGMSDDELRDLEEASIEVLDPQSKKADAQTDAGEDPSSSGDDAEGAEAKPTGESSSGSQEEGEDAKTEDAGETSSSSGRDDRNAPGKAPKKNRRPIPVQPN